MKRIVLAMALVAANTSQAYAGDLLVSGLANSTCRQFTTSVQNDQHRWPVAEITAAWLHGNLHSVAETEGFEQMPYTMSLLVDYLTNYCKNNPSKTINDSARNLVIADLNKRLALIKDAKK